MMPLACPRWVYRPGSGQPDRETLERVKALVQSRYETCVPADDPALVYGLALNDTGFFWECHEILEAVWRAAPQGGCDRILLRACIQTTNGNLKIAMEKPRAAARLYAEAAAALNELARRQSTTHGFANSYPADELARLLVTPQPPVMIGLVR